MRLRARSFASFNSCLLALLSPAGKHQDHTGRDERSQTYSVGNNQAKMPVFTRLPTGQDEEERSTLSHEVKAKLAKQPPSPPRVTLPEG